MGRNLQIRKTSSLILKDAMSDSSTGTPLVLRTEVINSVVRAMPVASGVFFDSSGYNFLTDMDCRVDQFTPHQV